MTVRYLDEAGVRTLVAQIKSALAKYYTKDEIEDVVSGIVVVNYDSITNDISEIKDKFGYYYTIQETDEKIDEAVYSALGGIQDDVEEMYTMVNKTLDNINQKVGVKYTIVDSLPKKGDVGVIYLVENSGEESNYYDEFLYVNGTYELIGTTKTDLSDYYTKKEVDASMVDITKQEIDIMWQLAEEDGHDYDELYRSTALSNAEIIQMWTTSQRSNA